MKQLDVIAAVLVVVGALNWGLVAVARFDLAVVYGLVGLAGAYQALSWKRVQGRARHGAAVPVS
jgi:hypothetical protein